MLEKLRTWVARRIVADVPAELSACLSCGQIQCVEGQFRTCRNRLAESARLKAMSDEPAPGTSAGLPTD